MGFLSENGVTALWNKIKANFGRSLSVSGTTITLQNGASTPTNLSQVTIPDATTSAAGAMSASDKSKLNGITAGANKYTHPTTSGNKHIPSGGSSGQILRWSADGTAAWGADANTEYSEATTSAAGLMSAADKTKLNGIATQANKYTHPSYTAKSAGLYKVTVDATGHVSAATAVAKGDITALGIPAQDTTYSVVSGDTAGLMSPSMAGTLNNAMSTAEQALDSANTAQSLARTAQSSADLAISAIGDRVTMPEVNEAIAAAQVGAAKYQGTVFTNATISDSSYKAGWYWVVSEAGTYVGEKCEIGDMIFANTDKGSTYSAAHFDVVQNNIVEMTASEVEAICTL